MNLGKIDTGIKGRQNVQVLKNGKVVRETGFQKNMLLDSFFAGLVAGNMNSTSSQSVLVGTGTTAPAANQTNIANFLAGKQGTDGTPTLTNLTGTATHNSYKLTRTWTFDESSVIGNVSEIATVFAAPSINASTLVHTRALVLDGGGQPNPITVGTGEQLRVIHELTLDVPKAAVSSNFSVTTKGNTTNHTVTMQHMNKNSNIFQWLLYGSPNVSFRPDNAYGTFSFGLDNGAPTGGNVVSSSLGPTVVLTNSTTIQVTWVLPSTLANVAGGIEGFSIGIFSPYGIKFVPKLPKDNLNKLTLSYTLSFTRL